jgi:hypothetical protein
MNDRVVHRSAFHLISTSLPASAQAPLDGCQAQAGISEAGHSLALRQHGPAPNHRACGTHRIGRPGLGAAA